MDRRAEEKTTFSLCELNNLIKSAISYALPDAYWVTAEIAEAKCNQKGHCYLELVEKEDGRTIAQSRATIWAFEYQRLDRRFRMATGESLKAGMKVLLLAAVSYHEVYGLSLNIRDIDPTYTLGEMARKKREVIDRLRKEGIIDLNKQLPFPLVPQRIAIISSPTAAGYGDFFDHLDRNPYGYRFVHILFPALMQGEEAEASIVSALDKVGRLKHLFDAAVIIRGGGSAVDLNCFDGYNLARKAAKFPLPVITGIGHEKDDTVVDVVAHTKMKTPTAVAEFLISGLKGFDERISELQELMRRGAEERIRDESIGLSANIQSLRFIAQRTATYVSNRISVCMGELKHSVVQSVLRAENRLSATEQAVRHLDPENVLRRGYSITHFNGRALRDVSVIKKGDLIETTLYNGTVSSFVETTKEAERSGQEQTVDLFPGFG